MAISWLRLSSWGRINEKVADLVIARIVSGGQAGMDRAALVAALELSLPCGGWCPKGRKAEDGLIAPRYPLQETPTDDYAQRTEWNVRDSDGTLVIVRGAPTGGTAQTIEFTSCLKKPCLVVDLENLIDPQGVLEWAAAFGVSTLNVAGPRESKCPGIYEQTAAFLRTVLAAVLGDST